MQEIGKRPVDRDFSGRPRCDYFIDGVELTLQNITEESANRLLTKAREQEAPWILAVQLCKELSEFR